MLISGTVVTGAGRGKTIGTPTINFTPDSTTQVTPGLYTGYVQLNAVGTWLNAVIHIGNRPTFNEDFSYEVHCLDTKITDTVTTVAVRLEHFLRPVIAFASVEDLQKQIAQDILDAKSLL